MRLHLPSGALATLDSSAPSLRVQGVFSEECAKLRCRLFTEAGDPVDVGELPLADLHTLRAIARRLGLVDEALVKIVCDNCGEQFERRPSETLELAPYTDDELDDPELDAAFAFDTEHRIVLRPGSPVSPPAGRRPQTRPTQREAELRIRLAPRTVREAEPLHAALARPGPFRFTSLAVGGMGLIALDELTELRSMARRLSRLPDEAFDGLVTLFEAAHYPARLETGHPCPQCGAVGWLLAPAEREFTARPDEVSSLEDEPPLPAGAAFMGIDEFERRVRHIAARVYAGVGVRNVDLIVEDGPAACDDAGVPLLGGYLPPDPDATLPKPPEVTLYYRTFAAMWRDDGGYDVDGEIEETLRHELEHHLGFLSGIDAMDDDERSEIADEYRRRVGRAEAGRRAVRSGISSVGGFIRATWWVWLLALLGAAALFSSGP